MTIHDAFTRRLAPNRRRTRTEATLEVDGREIPVEIVNISLTGMKLALATPLEQGTAVTISVLGAEIPAIVHWSDAAFAGLNLLTRLDGQTLKALEAGPA